MELLDAEVHAQRLELLGSLGRSDLPQPSWS
jgi:hypothetical protein